jgi:hypothetical protein
MVVSYTTAEKTERTEGEKWKEKRREEAKESNSTWW